MTLEANENPRHVTDLVPRIKEREARADEKRAGCISPVPTHHLPIGEVVTATANSFLELWVKTMQKKPATVTSIVGRTSQRRSK